MDSINFISYANWKNNNDGIDLLKGIDFDSSSIPSVMSSVNTISQEKPVTIKPKLETFRVKRASRAKEAAAT